MRNGCSRRNDSRQSSLFQALSEQASIVELGSPESEPTTGWLIRLKGNLATYRAKRDFSKTAEPSGKAAVVAAPQLRFVIQRHDATRLHYDFRLELDGVFKSWAVTKGPSLDPADKRLAVETEDHPLDYGDFEGTIPKGQYGGGTVQLWDRGYWVPEEDPYQGLKKGSLKFKLVGERLGGSWALVRMKWDRNGGKSKRNNWLLIKHRDEAATEGEGDAILKDPKSIASGRTLKEIALGTGRAPTPFMTGTKRPSTFSAGAVWNSKETGLSNEPAPTRKVAPKKVRSMPSFVEPQLCKLVERPPSGRGWVHEIKLDGYRLQLRVKDGEGVLRTRKGLDWTDKFTAVAEAAAPLPDCILDGEVCALDKAGAPDFAALQAAISEGHSERLIFFAFDLLFADFGQGVEDLRALPLSERKARLRELLASTKARRQTLRYVDHFETSGDSVWESACRMQLEGIVSKELAAPYKSGRIGSWVKSKCRTGHEVVIGGWTSEGTRLRSLLVGVHRPHEGSEKLVYVGRVGTGFSEKVMRALVPKLSAVESKKSPFAAGASPPKQANMHWAEPELVAEIEFAGWTGDGNVRQAAFKGLRQDKAAEEIEAEEPVKPSKAKLSVAPTGARSAKSRDLSSAKTKKGPSAALEATKGTTKARTTTVMTPGTAAVMGVTISKPSKPLFPDEKPPITKLDLAQYYEAVGPWMIEHLKGCPVSIVRLPDGIGGERFFQRHTMRGMSPLISQTKVRGDKEPYIQIDRVEGLIAAAQIAAIELHPWNNRPGNPDVPGRLVFDLDPAPDVGFNEVIKGALELRKRLEALGLVTFCKTTGGKGLHVVAPLMPDRKPLDWDTAKGFAKEVCRRLAEDQPDRYLLNMAKKERGGKIFLDYLRNDRTSTAVAPLSVRAREGAPVSMPLEWSQVKAGLDPMRYTLRTVPALLKKSKAWHDYDNGARSLRAVIEKLVGKGKLSA
jgi:bifunctional non-homologous end joining protein LigD